MPEEPRTALLRIGEVVQLIALNADDILDHEFSQTYMPRRYGPRGGGGWHELHLTIKYLVKDENAIQSTLPQEGP